jgi:hypothetical protein
MGDLRNEDKPLLKADKRGLSHLFSGEKGVRAI